MGLESPNPQDKFLFDSYKDIENKGFVLSTLDEIARWAQSGSMWPLTFGLACCGVEMMHTAAARYDLETVWHVFLDQAPGRRMY